MPTKEIIYDVETHDFRATLDGELVGYFPCYSEAEVELDRIVYERLSRGVAVQVAA